MNAIPNDIFTLVALYTYNTCYMHMTLLRVEKSATKEVLIYRTVLVQYDKYFPSFSYFAINFMSFKASNIKVKY